MQLVLEKGYSARGAQMGRRDELPDDPEQPIKLQMERLRWVDRDYDQGGAYWGQNGCNHVYCAFGEDGQKQVRVFARAMNRTDAKKLVREKLPNARFYR